MRNNIYKLIIGGLMCLCLTGCQKAPEKVVEDKYMTSRADAV